MFDPTAFENMKVVLEGHLYDKDLAGELSILDRNDLTNLSKLSREYSLQFKLRESLKDHTATITLKAGLENLAAELLNGNVSSSKQGSIIQLHFKLLHPDRKEIYHELQSGFQRIWGENRLIEQCVCYHPFKEDEQVLNKITIDFNRLILEDHIDDLLEMVDHMIETLVWLDTQKY
jgi:hypothetical protein